MRKNKKDTFKRYDLHHTLNEVTYDDFSLEDILEAFNLNVIEQIGTFSDTQSIEASSLLTDILEYNIPLALAINTKASRLEMLVSPILVELKKSISSPVSLFSGKEFNVNLPLGLVGTCDYILSSSEEQLYVKSSVVSIVEVVNDNVNDSIATCLVKMVAAQIFNNYSNNNPDEIIYGAVTTGNIWKFLRVEELTVTVDLEEYYINNLSKILGILTLFFKDNR